MNERRKTKNGLYGYYIKDGKLIDKDYDEETELKYYQIQEK